MSAGIFPLVFSSDELMLLTAIGLGFLFGFSLERGGFGNARKLAAQFYLYDMTVFKVMFTAILVAMVGLYTLQGLGLMDLSRLWINPTFVWAQLVGGFLLGVGFITSGLCPGTSIVSAASGRWDAVVAFLGIFVGTAVFAVAIEYVPGLETLYKAGSLDVSLLYQVFGVPPLVFVLIVLAMAGAGFIGAEKVEKIFAAKYRAVELTPGPRPRLKFTLVGAFAVIALLALGYRPGVQATVQVQVASIAPLSLAEAIIGRQPGMLILDMRPDAATAESRIPGSYPASNDADARALLATVPVGGRVVLVNAEGRESPIPTDWRRDVGYSWLQDGFLGWELKVLTPALPGDTQADREWAARQGQISAYFSGAAVQAVDVAAPPPMAGAGGEKPKKKGGC